MWSAEGSKGLVRSAYADPDGPGYRPPRGSGRTELLPRARAGRSGLRERRREDRRGAARPGRRRRRHLRRHRDRRRRVRSAARASSTPPRSRSINERGVVITLDRAAAARLPEPTENPGMLEVTASRTSIAASSARSCGEHGSSSAARASTTERASAPGVRTDVSSTIVTGPSLTSSTSMRAPKTPVATSMPSSRSTAAKRS